MANIKVTVTHPIADGTKLKFRTPCESTQVDGLIVKAPIKGGIGNAVKTFCFVDAHGTELSGVGNVFTSDVLIEVMLDVTKGRAYIKNADTNSYIESIKETLARFEEERKEIYAEAFTIIDECGKATKSANEAANTLKLSADEIRSGGFVEALKELNAGHNFLFWVGSTEDYNNAINNNAIPTNTLCIVTDDLTDYELIEKVNASPEVVVFNTKDLTEVPDLEEILNRKPLYITVHFTDETDVTPGEHSICFSGYFYNLNGLLGATAVTGTYYDDAPPQDEPAERHEIYSFRYGKQGSSNKPYWSLNRKIYMKSVDGTLAKYQHNMSIKSVVFTLVREEG